MHQPVWYWWLQCSICSTVQEQHLWHCPARGWGGVNLSDDVIACHQLTLLAVPSPLHHSAAHRLVQCHGCMLRSSITLHCGNLCSAGGHQCEWQHHCMLSIVATAALNPSDCSVGNQPVWHCSSMLQYGIHHIRNTSATMAYMAFVCNGWGEGRQQSTSVMTLLHDINQYS